MLHQSTRSPRQIWATNLPLSAARVRATPSSLRPQLQAVAHSNAMRYTLCAVIAGALVVVGSTAVSSNTPWPLCLAVAFFNSPGLLAGFILPSHALSSITVLAAPVVVYPVYALTLFAIPSRGARLLWVIGLMMVHSACLITWSALLLAGLAGALGL